MNAYTEFFTTTTSDDQDNYFTGETQNISIQRSSNKSHITEGNYRLIDGVFFQIVSGVPTEIVRDQIRKRIAAK